MFNDYTVGCGRAGSEARASGVAKKGGSPFSSWTRLRFKERAAAFLNPSASTADLRAKILDFGGFGSSVILILRGGIRIVMGNLAGISS